MFVDTFFRFSQNKNHFFSFTFSTGKAVLPEKFIHSLTKLKQL